MGDSPAYGSDSDGGSPAYVPMSPAYGDTDWEEYDRKSCQSAEEARLAEDALKREHGLLMRTVPCLHGPVGALLHGVVDQAGARVDFESALRAVQEEMVALGPLAGWTHAKESRMDDETRHFFVPVRLPEFASSDAALGAGSGAALGAGSGAALGAAPGAAPGAAAAAAPTTIVLLSDECLEAQVVKQLLKRQMPEEFHVRCGTVRVFKVHNPEHVARFARAVSGKEGPRSIQTYVVCCFAVLLSLSFSFCVLALRILHATSICMRCAHAECFTEPSTWTLSRLRLEMAWTLPAARGAILAGRRTLHATPCIV